LKRIPVKVNEFKGVIATGAPARWVWMRILHVPAESFQVLKRVIQRVCATVGRSTLGNGKSNWRACLDLNRNRVSPPINEVGERTGLVVQPYNGMAELIAPESSVIVGCMTIRIRYWIRHGYCP